MTIANTKEKLDKRFEEIEKLIPEKIDISQFKELSTDELLEILGLTIKQDNKNKIVAFLCELSAYTENSQFNISFNAPSSTGKSYIPLEISSLFPKEDVLKLGNCSPTAFYHEQGEYDKEKNITTIDLSRKIIIFLDQPHNSLLIKLRSLLSHDEKEIQSKSTDKNQKGGNRTKTVIIKGFPAVIFCSAGLKIDEQEGTRFLLLSPETGQEKIREAIHEKIKKETDNLNYKDDIKSNPERNSLKLRIKAIKNEHIDNVKISDHKKVEEQFLLKRKLLKPRHQRDVGRLISLIKILALLNLWFRKRENNVIIANDLDIEEAIKIWRKISESQEYNLPPYIYDLYKDVLVPLWEEKNDDLFDDSGLTRKMIFKKHFEVYGRTLEDFKLRQEIIPMLETAGLINQEADTKDKRKLLIFLPDSSVDSIKNI